MSYLQIMCASLSVHYYLFPPIYLAQHLMSICSTLKKFFYLSCLQSVIWWTSDWSQIFRCNEQEQVHREWEEFIMLSTLLDFYRMSLIHKIHQNKVYHHIAGLMCEHLKDERKNLDEWFRQQPGSVASVKWKLCIY
jgi:hypothetical protein